MGLSRTKIWRGFAVMTAAVVVWVVTFHFSMNSMKFPTLKPGATAAEISQQFADMPQPATVFASMSWMTVGQAVAGIVLIAGAVMTGMGLVEYSDELRRTG